MVAKILLEILITRSEWNAIINPSSKSEKISNKAVEVSIYGAYQHADAAGDYLSTEEMFLQDPRFDCGVPYQNPHKSPFSDLSDDNSESEPFGVVEQSNQRRPNQSIPSSQSLQNVLNSLHKHEYLHSVGPDEQLTVSLLPYVPHSHFWLELIYIIK